MASQPYLVIRLVPDAPVDGPTFATYLDGLQIQAFDAYTGAPLSDYAYASPLVISQNGAGAYGTVVSAMTSTSTPFSAGSYGTTLTFDSADAISIGSYAFTSDQTTIPPSSALQVQEVHVATNTVTLNNTLPNYVPAGTVVNFEPPTVGNVITGSSATAPSFGITTSAAALDINGKFATTPDEAIVLPVPAGSEVNGILVGMAVTPVAGAPIAANTTVAAVNQPSASWDVDAPSITLSQPPPAVPGSGAQLLLTWSPPYVSLTLNPTGSTTAGTSSTLNFASGQGAQGVAVGMTVSPISTTAVPTSIAAGTIVTDVTLNSVTISPALTGATPASVTFTFPLSSGIVQDVDTSVSFSFFVGVTVQFLPQSVATVVLPLNSATPPKYLDIKIVASRFSQALPFENIYYNVLYSQDQLPTTDQYSSIPANEVSLYLSLPPPPIKSFVSLTLPSDGSPPPFDLLYQAITSALSADPIETLSAIPSVATVTLTAYTNPSTTTLTFNPTADTAGIVPNTFVSGNNIAPGTLVIAVTAGTPSTVTLNNQTTGAVTGPITFTPAAALVGALVASSTYCSRIAYDIVWSYQNSLPLPPDSIDDLYTNPPNPGGSNGSTKDTTNPLEQDRIKFEGSLSSFYSTRNANAERLTKFVAAASAAVLCEQASLNSTAAIMIFPVDPSSTFATEVESEILLQGLGINGVSGINFGVPAAFFYALGANLDKSTDATRRFQMATGDSIDRLLQLFTAAQDQGVLNSDQGALSKEDFADASLVLPSITPFQAARRLAALGVSTASTSPTATLFPGTPLASLIGDWLIRQDPAAASPSNPPLTYLNTDFNIWTESLESSDPQGYLYLDLDALTQGFIIPPSSATPTGTAGSTLTFEGGAIGVGVGMPVSGTNIVPGTVVTQVTAVTTITSNAGLGPGGVSPSTAITFTSGSSTITASPNGVFAAGATTVTFAATAASESIAPGMTVSGTGIAATTVVQTSDTTTAVTLSIAPSGAVTTPVTFNFISVPVQANTVGDTPSGKILTLTSTAGISVGMSALGTNIALGTTVQAVNSPNITLSTAIIKDIGAGSPINFVTIPTEPILPIAATTTADCAAGSPTLTFGGAGATAGISAGMSVYGPGIPLGTLVKSVAAPIVTLSAGASALIPTGSVINFLFIPSTLADQIFAWLPSTTSPSTPKPTVATLKQVTATQWTNFFTYTGSPAWLPPFTQPVAPGASPSASSGTQKPGYIAMRIRAFIRAVQQFFTVSSVATSAQLPPPNSPPVFDQMPFDLIAQAMSGLTFGTATTAQLTTAAAAVPSIDLATQAWLAQTLIAINDLYQVASTVPAPAVTPGFSLPYPVSFNFSLMEAMYARGFRSVQDITNLSGAEFAQSLIGTVAYDFAATLYGQAGTLPSASTPPSPPSGQTGSTFQPINPDGTLVNCVPPPCLSPTGPIAYLQELLKLSPASTCANPWAVPGKGQMTLGDALTTRRGPLGTLLASCANLETPLPLIDIVNESLEYLGSAPPPPLPSNCGTVYDTSADELAGYRLCRERECLDERDRPCHDPAAIFGALPEYSTPATPVPGENDSVEPAVYNNLKSDFSACLLPYSQALDVSRTYLRHFGTCRYEELRTFRKCITEFALSPANPPSGFQSHLWRYPVRIETAIEYLGITPEEYALLFGGTPAQLCGTQPNPTGQPTGQPPGQTQVPGQPTGQPTTQVPGQGSVQSVAQGSLTVAQLYGLSPEEQRSWEKEIPLPDFLARTCLTYCEFLELWKAVYPSSATYNPVPGRQIGVYPDCEPCCLADYQLNIPDGDGYTNANEQTLIMLAVFIRLWRKLKDVCGAGYPFAQLFDICTVLQFFNSGSINPEFIRQLAAFQMLRDHFRLPLLDPKDHTPGTTGADRTHLLALWVGTGAKKWRWAVDRLVEGVECHARLCYGCVRPRGEGIAHMVDNLDALSRLAGFNPPTATTPSTDTWNSTPGCTLRFAEVLAKICASNFRIGELLYMFNAAPPEDCESPFPSQDDDEAVNFPLDLPEEERDHSLWRLREKLLRVEVGEEEVCRWTWPRLVTELRAKFGYVPTAGQDPLLSIGQHFFPSILEASGYSVSGAQRKYQTTLTSTLAWNTPDSPFQYDAGATQLSMQLPLRDEAVAAKLSQLAQLGAAEQAAVQDLYFAPRVDLVFLAFLFPDWQSAEIHLIQERDETRRWEYFRRHIVLAEARRRVIAEHLAHHVHHRSNCDREELEQIAGLVLSQMRADENGGTPWESDSGMPPTPTMWTQPPSGNAIAALLGALGTGLLGEYQIVQTQTTTATGKATGKAGKAPGKSVAKAPAADSGPTYQVLWREVRGPMAAFGHERDHTNSPVPTVLPELGLVLPANPLVTLNNGYAVKTADGQRLGGAEAFRVHWSGVLLIEHEGEYSFHAGAPTPEGERPDFERAEKSQWRVTLTRGHKTSTILNHQWPGDTNPDRNMPRLRRGAYQIAIEYSQPAPDFNRPQHTGFEVKYRGPDSEDRLVALPLSRLYRDLKDQTLDQGIQFLPGSKNAQAFLKAYYTSTLRDVRRTYQRAFKAILFAGRFALSARPGDDECPSELGYMLQNAALFCGYAYYRTSPTTFMPHLANFDFDFLPLSDNYYPPVSTPPDRSAPSLQRTQAMFAWWERIFDYVHMRKEVHQSCEGRLWRLFQEALANPPTDVARLLRYIGAEPEYWELDLRFYQDQSTAIYAVSSSDLQDERWLIRVWHADRWIRRVLKRFHSKNISAARPDLWASLDPSAPLTASGLTQTGNANLLEFLTDGCLDNGEPYRYAEVRRLNDGLRERGRNALVAYLCAMNRVSLPWAASTTYATTPRDLSDLLLLDVEAGTCERASRIDEAISAVQAFVRRNRLGVERDWRVDREFAKLWDGRFDTYRTWERCKRRELYRENWIEWSELEKARRIEAFRFLESRLKCSTLTLAAPGGLDWWADDDKALEQEPKLLQRRIPSELQPLAGTPPAATREGFGTLGTPEFAAQPAWLAAVPQSAASSGGSSGSSPGGTPPAGTPPGAPPNTPPGTTQPAPGGAVAAPAIVASSGRALAQAAASGSGQPQTLPLWMEAAIKLGTHFLRVAAAGIPEAAREFVPHGKEPHNGCCRECGCDHPALVDEYYFWLVDTQFYTYTDDTDAQSNPDVSFSGSYQVGFQDSYYDQFQQQSAEWNDEDQVPALLAKWQPNPAVRLSWCRVHNGEFGQPRKSETYVAIDEVADLVLLGRAGDSLFFQVSGADITLPPGYSADTSPPGFRYDLVSDQALALPEALAPAPPVPQVETPPGSPTTPSYPGGLKSYPFFAYDEPGARLFPAAWFSPALAVAQALRSHCYFELALKWYKRAFNPLDRDCAWMHCLENTQSGPPANNEIAKRAYQIWEQHGRPPAEQLQDWTEAQAELQASPPAVGGPTDSGNAQGACCDSADVTEHVARQRELTLEFCQTMVDWSEHLMRRRRSPEAFQQARLLLDTVSMITGRCPRTILLPEPASPAPVATFVPAYAPLNPRLLELYGVVADRRAMIHHCIDARRLRDGRLGRDMSYFGDSPLREGWRTVPESCGDDEDWCCRPSPYRFVAQIQKAIEIVGRVRELENSYLTIREKGDAEYLASLRAGQERELLALGLSIRQDAWREADWEVQALQQAKESSQTSLIYYNNLYQTGLINDEIQNLTLNTIAMQTRTSSNIAAAIGEAMTLIPDFYVGAMSTFTQIPIGQKLGAFFGTIAKIMQTVADIQSSTAAIDATEATWERRSAEWFQQTLKLPIDIKEAEFRILGQHRKRDQAMQELNNQQRQMENAAEVQDFLRDKFTAADLYLWLQKETHSLHCRLYDLARCAAHQAQRAFNFERGHTTRRFIPEECCDGLHEGLMAGERLEVALRHMEKAYLDENVREYELTKHFSLRLHFPMEFLRLKTTGRCEVELPEWMYDLDYPGQYMRRIRSVSLTIPCVTGPYTGVHCRATLLSSVTRIDPRLELPATHCCCECNSGNGYETCPHDPRIVRMYGAKEAICTSSGQNDSGLFEFSRSDPRYLPFELHGANCRLLFELPFENNAFPMESLTDLLVTVGFTSWEGGELLRRAANEAAQRHLPGSGWCVFDVRHEFPDAWQLLQNSCRDRDAKPRLNLRLERKMFPFIPGAEELSITQMALLFNACADECDDRRTCVECPCPEERGPACRVVEFSHGSRDEPEDPERVSCVASDEWPELYCGLINRRIGPLGRWGGVPNDVRFRFPAGIGELERVFLLCRYERSPNHCSDDQDARPHELSRDRHRGHQRSEADRREPFHHHELHR